MLRPGHAAPVGETGRGPEPAPAATAPRIAGDTMLFGIVGDPIAQARSPLVFNPKIADAGVNAVLVPLHVPAAVFETAIRGVMQVANLSGLVVTLPFKERAMALADRVGHVGRSVGAINAIRREADGSWTGDMFDGLGLVRALAEAGVEPRARSFMLLGAGGAGRAIAISLAVAGAASVAIHDVDAARAEDLAVRLSSVAPSCSVRVGEPALDGIDVLVNATPVGMKAGDGLPAPFTTLPPRLVVADIVPVPGPTPLLELAAGSRCRTVEGTAMVRGQADAILEFFGVPPVSPASPRRAD